jgi:hypothetical protein
METVKINPVKNPTVMVAIKARGTAELAFEHSSARWIAPSIPAYI